jgi:hypothetical protein
MPRALAVLAAIASAVLGGCGHSQRCDFDDRPRAEVWQAVVQACREPRYPDWVVVRNEVHVDEADGYVSVYRDLRREERKWRFTAAVSPSRPTTVTLASPDWAVPGHFWREADHFFGQVRMRLVDLGPVLPAPGDPMGGAAAAGERDPQAPGHRAEPPAAGQLAAP